MENKTLKFRAWLNMQEEMLYSDLFGAGEKFAGRDCEIMQFTGLLDRNGKEIYEGDIIKGVYSHINVPFEVKWNLNGYKLRCVEDCFENNVRYIEKDRYIDLPTHMDISEIVGNIYEK